MVYERYLRFGEGIRRKVGLGLQQEKIGASFCFVVPNPSPANAGFSFHTLVGWYLELKAFLEDKEISEIISSFSGKVSGTKELAGIISQSTGLTRSEAYRRILEARD